MLAVMPDRVVHASIPLEEWRARRRHGIELAKHGQYDKAKKVFLSIGDFLNISAILTQEERYEEAMEAAQCALQTEPVKAHVQMAAICYNLGDVAQMEEHVQRGLALDLSYAKLYEARGVIRLGRGDIRGGFEDWKSRTWPRVGTAGSKGVDGNFYQATMPEWDGQQRLDGKTCWILQEQGLGDQLLWARAFTGFTERTGCKQMVLAPTPGLERLFQNSFPDAIVVNSSTPDKPVADAWASQATVQIHAPESVPWNGPYLRATPEDIARLSKLIPVTGRLRVGLCWSGSPGYYIDRDRSMPFTSFAPILKVDGVDFHSLQFGFSSNENAVIPDLSLECRDFADTAAVLHALDLVITVDTALANLAGAMGIPCWVMVRPPIDYRYGFPVERHDWFPAENLRQFREVIPAVVAEALAERVTPAMRAIAPPPGEKEPETMRVNTRYGRMDIYTYGMWCNRSLKVYGEWSELEMDVMRAMTPLRAVVVEAGANIGSHTLGLMKFCSEVWAFEPHPGNFRLLQANVLSNPTKAIVHAYNVAVGEEAGTGEMEQFDPTIPCNPGGVQLRLKPDGETEVTTIDSLELERVDLIKADVESFELATIKGAIETIKRCRPVLYVEDTTGANQEELYVLLDSLGYRLHKQKIAIWNKDNWRGQKINVFGNQYSEMLLAVPNERTDLLQSRYCQGKPC